MNNSNLWAPWRGAYLRDLARRAESAGGDVDETGNFLARYWATPGDDRRNHVVLRNAHGLILLNRYPYANGHLLVALGEPRPALLDYEPGQRREFWRLVELGMDLMQRALAPQGVNVGINQGSAAGAGVPEHLHAHLVPRWHGDTNFLSTVGHVRVIPDALEAMARQYEKVAEAQSG